MSSSILLRRSPNQGLTAMPVKVPRSLRDHQCASFAFHRLTTFSSTGSRSCTEPIFWLAIRRRLLRRTPSMRSPSVMKYGEVALVELVYPR